MNICIKLYCGPSDSCWHIQSGLKWSIIFARYFYTHLWLVTQKYLGWIPSPQYFNSSANLVAVAVWLYGFLSPACPVTQLPDSSRVLIRHHPATACNTTNFFREDGEYLYCCVKLFFRTEAKETSFLPNVHPAIKPVGFWPSLMVLGVIKLSSALSADIREEKKKEKKHSSGSCVVSFWQRWCESVKLHVGNGSSFFFSSHHSALPQPAAYFHKSRRGRWPFVPKHKLWERTANTHTQADANTQVKHTAWETPRLLFTNCMQSVFCLCLYVYGAHQTKPWATLCEVREDVHVSISDILFSQNKSCFLVIWTQLFHQQKENRSLNNQSSKEKNKSDLLRPRNNFSLTITRKCLETFHHLALVTSRALAEHRVSAIVSARLNEIFSGFIMQRC